MRTHFLLIGLLISFLAAAQQESDSTYRRCPLYITDTVSSNNFFIEALPATIRVFRVRGDLTIEIRQKEQYLTLFFHSKKLKNRTYKILKGGNNRPEVESRYSFRSGDQVSYVDLSKGTLESAYDKEKKLWRIKVNGLMANMVDRSVTYYKVKSDFYIR